MTDAALALALRRVPDEPRWVDTRGMLLSGAADVWVGGATDPPDSLVVTLRARALVSIVGRPSVALLTAAIASVRGDVNVLVQPEDSDHAAGLLTGWPPQTAILHTRRSESPSNIEAPTTIFTRADAPPLGHVPEPLGQELREALAGHPLVRFVHGDLPGAREGPQVRDLPIAAAWADGLPVSFCYPVVQTETLWDVSIDTIESYRGRGLGESAARAMMAHMERLGKLPVWGALESNAPSRRLAARLGFVENSRLMVFTAC